MENFSHPRFETEGFTTVEWKQFQTEGLIIRRGVFNCSEVQALLSRCQEFEKTASTILGSVDGGFRNTLAVSSAFARLVCDQRLLGPAYDLFGEMTALHGFDLFIRPVGSKKEHSWHIDGPRRLPYATFFQNIPPVIKFGIWLTDVETEDEAAYQYMPGSHTHPCVSAYGKSCHLSGQKTLKVRAGDVSIHHADLWHRVSPNQSKFTRYNFFVAYSPAWITPRETFYEVDALPDLPKLETLLRRYNDLTHRIKPPSDECPLHCNADMALMNGARFGEPPILSHSERPKKT